MACKIFFHLGSNKNTLTIEVSTNMVETDFVNGNTKEVDFFKIAEAVMLSSEKENLSKLVQKFYGTTVTIPSKIFKELIPNYTMRTLREHFNLDKLSFGKNFDAKIVLVDKVATTGLEGIPSYRTLRPNSEGNVEEVFIIRTRDLSKFAKYTRIRSAINTLCSGLSEIEDSDKILGNIENLRQLLISKLSDQKEKNTKKNEIQKEKELLLQSLQRELLKVVDNYKNFSKMSEEELLEQLKNERIEFLLKTILELNVKLLVADEDKKSALIKDIEKYQRLLGEKEVNTYIKRYKNKNIENKNKEYKSALENLASIESGTYTNNEIKKLNQLLKDIDTLKIPSTVKEFLEDFVNNKSKYLQLLDHTTFLELEDLLRVIDGKISRRKYGSKLADNVNLSLSYPIEEIGRKMKLLPNERGIYTKDLIELLKEDLELDDETKTILDHYSELPSQAYNIISDLIKLYITEKTDGILVLKTKFVDFNRNKDIIKFKESYQTLDSVLGNESIKTLYNPDVIEENYRGFNIYEINLDGNPKYFFSDHIVSIYDPKLKMFDSLDQVYNEIEKLLEHTPIINFSKKFLSDYKLNKYMSEIEGPHYFALYSIIQRLNIEYGKKIIPTDLFLSDIELWITDRFGISEDASDDRKALAIVTTENENILLDKYIIQLLSDEQERLNPEKVALFLSYFSNIMESYLVDDDSFQKTKKEVLTKLLEINETDLESYIVLNCTSRYHKLLLTKLPDSNIEELFKIEDNSDRPKPIILALHAFANECSERGIPVQIITLADMRAQGMKNTPNAFVKNGIIYLNANKASYQDGLHEYTHILLGILKANSPETYKLLLSKFKEMLAKKLESERTTIDEIMKSYRLTYSELYKTLSEDEILEEIFAEEYSKFLLGKKISDIDIFTDVNLAVNNDSKTIFNELGDDLFFDRTTTFYDLLTNFSTLVKLLMEKIGFKLPTTKHALETVNNFIESAELIMSENDFEDGKLRDKKLLKICN